MYYFLFVADLSSTHLQHRDTDTEKHGIIASMTAIRHFTLSSVYLKKKKMKEKKREEKKRKEKDRGSTYPQENLILPNSGSSNCTASSNSCPL